jgi:hypothetical protein
MELTHATNENNIANVNIDTSSTDTSPSSFETPKVVAAGRPPLSRVRKSHLQATQIAELQAQLQEREIEIEGLHQHVLRIMTSESLSNAFPATPTYVNVEGKLVTKLHMLQTEMKQKELEFRETLRYLETQQQANPRVTFETSGPHSLQAKPPRPEDLLYQQKLQDQQTAVNKIAQEMNATTSTVDPNQHLVDVFKQITRDMKENKTSDATDPLY